MIMMFVIGLIGALFLAFATVIFVAYEMTTMDKTPQWFERTYDFLFGWL